jgi:hypothetical protein
MTNLSGSSTGAGREKGLGDTARDVKRSVAEEGRRLADDAVEQAESAAKEQQTAAASYMKSLSSAIEDGSRTLNQRGYSSSAVVATRAASDIDELASALAEKSPRDLLREVETFARDRPAVFFGAALLTGFGISRFLKSAPPGTRDEHRRADRAAPLSGSETATHSSRETWGET